MSTILVFEVDAAGNFRGDVPLHEGQMSPDSWTRDRPMQPAYSPRYVQYQRDTSTGQCFGGVWEDPGAPLPEDLARVALQRARDSLISGVQGYLDTLARSIGYDSILSLCTYASSSNPHFQAQGQAGVALRDQCWAIGQQITADVLSGVRPVPALQEVLDELPAPAWLVAPQ